MVVTAGGDRDYGLGQGQRPQLQYNPHEDCRITGHPSQLGGSTSELGRSTALAGVFRYLLETDLLGGTKIRPDRFRGAGSRARNRDYRGKEDRQVALESAARFFHGGVFET